MEGTIAEGRLRARGGGPEVGAAQAHRVRPAVLRGQVRGRGRHGHGMRRRVGEEPDLARAGQAPCRTPGGRECPMSDQELENEFRAMFAERSEDVRVTTSPYRA